MNLKIISFCNYPYREIALNWVKHLEALSIDSYEVLCLDPESDEYLNLTDAIQEFLMNLTMIGSLGASIQCVELLYLKSI